MIRSSTGQEALSPQNQTNALDYYYAELSHLSLLTHEEEQTLARRVRAGDREARARFIESNLRLVVHLARAYIDCGLDLSDLTQEGNIGLIRAVDRFDPDRGIHFATFAAWWIKQAILRALDNHARTIRLPSYLLARLRHLSRDEQPSPVEPRVLSLDLLRGQDADCDLLGLFAGDEDEPTLRDLCAQETQAECAPHIRAMLSCLTPRERRAVTLHFGLDGKGGQQSLREIGQEMGICKERVRQLLESALSKLRHSQEAGALASIWCEQQAC